MAEFVANNLASMQGSRQEIVTIKKNKTMEYQMPRYANRLSDIEHFHVVDVLKKAKEMALSGRDIIHMEAGEPDFSTVQPIIDAAKKALDQGRIYYTGALGMDALRQKLSDFYRARYQLDIPGAASLSRRVHQVPCS